jgi:hypothetical protein
VSRAVGLPAGVPVEGRVAPPADAPATSAPQPPPAEKGEQGEAKPADGASTEAAASQAATTEQPPAADTAPASDGGEPQAHARAEPAGGEG